MKKKQKQAGFPRTTVGGISLSRMIIGTNWFIGCSHMSKAKDKFINNFQTYKNIADIIIVFLEHGIDTVMGMPVPILDKAITDAENRTGKKCIRILTPWFNILPNPSKEASPEYVFDYCKNMGATFCMPHQSVTDALLDKMYNKIRNIDEYARMIRERGMVPGLSTHMPEAVTIADKTGIDIETYVQIYNAVGFLMQVETDWVMRIIKQAKKPVMTIKPLAAGKILPPVGLAFVWNTIREQDMVTIGTITPDEAKEVIDISLDFLSRRIPGHELQKTRSKKSLE